jgi:hypothetical protein
MFRIRHGRARTLTLLLPLALAFVAALVAANGATAHAAPSTEAFDTALQKAFKACVADAVRTDGRYTLFDPSAFYACLGSRGYSVVAHAPAAPGNITTRTPAPSRFEIDLFSTFTSCLAEAAHGDSMYPGIHPNEVTQCLEAHGVL